MKSFRESPVVLAFVLWWVKIVPTDIFSITLKIIGKLFDYFSIDLLLKTLFLPWKRDEIDTSNLSLDLKFRVWMMNLMSRLIGATVRMGVVLIGVAAIASAFITGLIILVGFVILPPASLYLLFSSFL